MPENFRTHFLTGLFFLITILTVTFLLFFLQGYKGKPEGRAYTLVFDQAPGIRQNSEVFIGGRNVGTVESVGIDQKELQNEDLRELKTQVLVHIRISPEFKDLKLYKDAYANVTTQIFGASSIDLVPGGKELGKLLQEGERIPGVAPTTLQDMAHESKALIKTLQNISEEIYAFVNDQEFQDKLKETASYLAKLGEESHTLVSDLQPSVQDAADFISNGREISEELKALIHDNRTSVDRVIENLELISENARDFSETDFQELTESFNTLAQDLSNLSTEVQTLLANNQGDLYEIVINLKDTSQYLKETLYKLRRDPSILIWGGDEEDATADLQPIKERSLDEEIKLRSLGYLPPRERDE